jgi:hypothetical protein
MCVRPSPVKIRNAGGISHIIIGKKPHPWFLRQLDATGPLLHQRHSPTVFRKSVVDHLHLPFEFRSYLLQVERAGIIADIQAKPFARLICQ